MPTCSDNEAKAIALQYIARQTSSHATATVTATPELILLPCARVIYRSRKGLRAAFTTLRGSYSFENDDLDLDDADSFQNSMT